MEIIYWKVETKRKDIGYTPKENESGMKTGSINVLLNHNEPFLVQGQQIMGKTDLFTIKKVIETRSAKGFYSDPTKRPTFQSLQVELSN